MHDRGLATLDEEGGECRWSWAQHVQLSADRAALLDDLLSSDAPRHFGVLLDNVPEFSFLLGAAALSGTVLVGLNSTRRGTALARDIAHADCRIVVTNSRNRALLDGLDLGDVLVLDIDSDDWPRRLDRYRNSPIPGYRALPDDLLMLVFTSGTSGDPKAVRCTHRKVAFPGTMLAERFGLGTADVVYLAMPMFHSNSIMAGWAVSLAAGAGIALRAKFSASRFLGDVRRFGATYANYVGKPLSYVLATPARPDDADNPLRIMYGNEGSAGIVDQFATRFDVRVLDAFGSTEGGVAIRPDPAAPIGALGRLPDGVQVLDPDGKPCPPATFDSAGRLINGDVAIGEMVNTSGPGEFAGYYNDPAADADRMRDGRYFSGDLAYVDDAGYVYFAGRTAGWLRVDGENLTAAPIERILLRYSGFRRVAVYAVPDPAGGDQVMAAVVPNTDFDTAQLHEFLGNQPDLGPKQWPRYIRVCADLPQTATFKVLTRVLAAEGTQCADPVWELPPATA
ncbi:long-chain-fatty-acid--CoA ligase [Aldersonia sp. NBC_00410]|uniref:long-chain-fatty-acid--CoA ligase n=1 Tax=Aldersonia sp. NBC_00410 TaxID=2975954 RepID=UPI002253B353|nr:long-chain-fatty-acid--CoA ligase [Aldersonia sp. NBC_00410]MCX5043350.1 long-chain-fatty-acid--CoA ligase [Aldersonia sp. NBC_00410]